MENPEVEDRVHDFPASLPSLVVPRFLDLFFFSYRSPSHRNPQRAAPISPRPHGAAHAASQPNEAQ